jgi:hypothetical protein
MQTGPTTDADVVAIERWFVERGVPHLVETRLGGRRFDTWTRALPILVVAYLLLGLNALDLRNWSLRENLLAAVAVIAILIATWAVSNRLRGVPTFSRPTAVGGRELVLFVFGPAIPGLVFGQPGDALQTVILALVLLALIFVWSSYGVGALVRWGIRRSGGQLTGLGPLVARALPLLLLFNTFLFINAEVWEVAGTLDGVSFVVVILTFFALGATFVVSRVPGFIRQENRFASNDEVVGYLAGTPAHGVALPATGPVFDPLRRRQRYNIGLIVLFGQALQITLVALSLTAFFVFFGFMAITPATTINWTGLADFQVLAEVTFDGEVHVLSEPLIRVSVFLGAFTGMYFTVLLSTDDTYRSEFSEDVGPEIRQILAMRCAYHESQRAVAT